MSVNSYIANAVGLMCDLYSKEKKSIPEISGILKLPQSCVRRTLLTSGVVLRSRDDGVRNSAPKLGSGMRGKSRVFSAEHREAISKGRLKKLNFTGYRVTSQGYLTFTRGDAECVLVHNLLGRMLIGRKLNPDEVVHHRDHDRQNNSLDNLQVMTSSDHSKLHATAVTRIRGKNGKFKGESNVS